MQPYATDNVSLGSAEEPYDSDMTHSYRLTEGRLIRYPMIHRESEDIQWALNWQNYSSSIVSRADFSTIFVGTGPYLFSSP